MNSYAAQRRNLRKVLFAVIVLCCSILMMFPASAAKVKLSTKKLTLQMGQKKTIKVKNAKKTVKWSSSNKKVATVSKGTVKGIAPGTAKIKAKVGSKTYACSVKVVSPKLNKTSAKVQLGGTLTLKLSKAAYAGKVTWTSSNTKIASVSSKGKVKALMPGTVKVKAKVGKKTLTCKVTVTNVDADVTITFQNVAAGACIAGATTARASFQLNNTSANVSASVVDSAGTVVYKTTYTKCAKGKTYSFDWKNTSTEAGTYQVQVKAGTVTTSSAALVFRKNVFAGGTGSPSDPFQVQTFDQLKMIEAYNGYAFIQTANINCAYETFTGLFTVDNPFTGTYNGNGKMISNLFLSDNGDDNASLFRGIGEGGSVSSLILYKINVTGKKYCAVLAAVNAGKITNCIIRECSVVQAVSGSDCWSGIIVQDNKAGATISGCKVEKSTISASYGWYSGWTGGLVSTNHGNVADCTITGSTIKSVSTSYGWTRGGALISYNEGNAINCVANGCTMEEASGNCTWSGNLASTNKGLMSACSFVNGTSACPDFHENSGTYVP